ncbi:MAG: hypothetical protein RLY78_4031 [Pseudomonadota bacterium]|jgi:prolyl-tRNA editing enzyme YbaK/EbsC (Cys-tRNA(Pro) deacylase)
MTDAPSSSSAVPDLPAAARLDPPRPADGFERVRAVLRAAAHPHPPLWLDTPARTCAEAAAALGVREGQIAKSVVFRHLEQPRAVLVIASGDRRVDVAKVAALVGPVGRADAAYVKAHTGFSIGGVSPVGHAEPPLLLLDADLARFDAIWAAAGHPNGVFRASIDELQALTGCPLSDVCEDAGG